MKTGYCTNNEKVQNWISKSSIVNQIFPLRLSVEMILNFFKLILQRIRWLFFFLSKSKFNQMQTYLLYYTADMVVNFLSDGCWTSADSEERNYCFAKNLVKIGQIDYENSIEIKLKKTNCYTRWFPFISILYWRYIKYNSTVINESLLSSHKLLFID